ncbi:4-hydroxy-tetrahydrodipicolinate reductase [Aliiglaciecola sp. 2_MG-2023]|uniref:4-hydroxy-tetrahydrodipicolinate reductase n=1 Tax=Alteromonadaceae TaxID=72275 RepID=UPI0026E114A9|nr:MULTISPECIES: 4-hydroxy-tetrahydrodipicolinate reductase [unclassified Aliiglaciecola]MDO6711658.1 4-hydroxy-tetrahydrodipicolinate reductase [Aliiglaciecola sp. 2_MG-2023]MDO6752729.1 4-hydroxy-tetrahydrodipicolinate reductase [Aliiglaciecola sp. 1_MG-2023]
MTGIGILGANGRMGRVLIDAAHLDDNVNLAAASVREGSQWIGMDAGELAGIGKQNLSITASLDQQAPEIDVVIDFTLPDVLEQNLAWCVANNKAIVIGTTGLNDNQKALLQNAATKIPVVFAANYSVGVNLMLNLVRQAAKTMGDTADIEILEAHHRFKKDAPSGTAMAIGEAIADEIGRDLKQCAVYGREGDTGERKHETIGFATVRAGDVVGEHTALFADIGERLEITHKASSRLTFAKGAITAAKWLVGKPAGLYSMQDVLGFN